MHWLLRSMGATFLYGKATVKFKRSVMSENLEQGRATDGLRHENGSETNHGCTTVQQLGLGGERAERVLLTSENRGQRSGHEENECQGNESWLLSPLLQHGFFGRSSAPTAAMNPSMARRPLIISGAGPEKAITSPKVASGATEPSLLRRVLTFFSMAPFLRASAHSASVYVDPP